jgi:zinc/manganese transport system permease protein
MPSGISSAAAALVGLAGLLLLLFPQMDHHWFNWLEEALPVVQFTFLTPRERETYRDSRQAIRRALDELERLRAMQQEIQWGTRQMPTEMQERLRQFLAGRGEITAGDRMVLKTLRGKAREHQRYWLGLPLLGIGLAGALALARPWRRMGPVLR